VIVNVEATHEVMLLAHRIGVTANAIVELQHSYNAFADSIVADCPTCCQRNARDHTLSRPFHSNIGESAASENEQPDALHLATYYVPPINAIGGVAWQCTSQDAH
jgi:3-hydroxyisobutyrate dehydrogenase-like beta-hydroxyacid dehydrogenase